MRFNQAVVLIASTLLLALIVSACDGNIPTSSPPTLSPAPSTPAPSTLAPPTSALPYKVRYTGPFISGNIAYILGKLVSGKCNLFCSYPLATVLPPGYGQAEVLLTGWQAENLGGSTRLHRLALSARSMAYDPATGNFNWEAAADIRETADFGDEYRFTLYFTIVLTKPAGAQLVVFPHTCSKAAGAYCKSNIIVASIIPPGWELLALGVQGFALQSGSGSPPNGILLNHLAIDVSSWKPVGSDLDTHMNCEMGDATPTEPISCGIDVIAIVAAPGEAYQVHFASSHTSPTSYTSNATEIPPPLAIPPMDGAFGGLERFLLTFPIKHESKTWSWAADYNDILICPNMIDFCYNRIGFLGDTFGSMTNLVAFDMEIKAFSIWIRPP